MGFATDTVSLVALSAASVGTVCSFISCVLYIRFVHLHFKFMKVCVIPTEAERERERERAGGGVVADSAFLLAVLLLLVL
jgi:hypothetical protein